MVFRHTLCPNKSDPLADFLITCNKVYRIKHNFMNTYPYVLQRIMQSFWKIHLSVTEKSNRKQNHKRTTVQLLNNNLYSVSQWQCLNLMFKVSAFGADTVLQSDEFRRLGWQQQSNRFASVVSWGIVLLKRKERSRYWKNGWQKMLLPQ